MKTKRPELKLLVLLLFSLIVCNLHAQEVSVRGQVRNAEDNEAMVGATIAVKGSKRGTIADSDGNFEIFASGEDTLVFSFIGFASQEIRVGTQTFIRVNLKEDISRLDEVVVVGYGSQKKSDITGTVASLSDERLEMVPNVNIEQALQGALPGIQITMNAAGASPDNSIVIRGRSSIRASNSPLIVVDGFPYNGQLSDINVNDIESVEILKDASAASIYGSRGSNGVILVTTKTGDLGKAEISYDGYFSVQDYANYPDFLTPEEFYDFKMHRDSTTMTQTERDIYQNRGWSDWADLALRKGKSQQHTLSVKGGTKKTRYFFSTGILDIRGLAINDDYMRINNRVNLESRLTDWLSVGTRSSLYFTQKDGLAPSFSGIAYLNPLTNAYEEDGVTLAIYPNQENPNNTNPLERTLVTNLDRSYQVISNNFVKVDIPFIPGLNYQLNAGIRYKFSDDASYWGRNTQSGFENRGRASTDRSTFSNATLENIIHYTAEFGRNRLFVTGLYSYEHFESTSNRLKANGFPNDFLTWYSADQAELIEPSYGYSRTSLISQMLRINYGFDERYLLTLTGRRDGYSGFGSQSKWGVFPSLAIGWNLANESFFPWPGLFNVLKLRGSWGLNGNQAVGAYETLSRLSSEDWISDSSTRPGYKPSKLGQDNLGWESKQTFNLGLDFGLWKNRVYGDINIFKSATTDLLLNRSISPVHGISSITQNIGEVENRGLELSLTSTNVSSGGFRWSTTGNLSFLKNKIISLYGYLDEEGNEIGDIGNNWFIGEPIRVYYGWEVLGVWQLEEAEEAAKYGSLPGYVKLNDLDRDYDIDADDRKILGQKDPKFLWGLTNTFEYKNFTLRLFMHGVHGVTKRNSLKNDNVWTDISRNTTKKNWWREDNPTNDFYMNAEDANKMGGGIANYYENGSFIRIKDITLAYDLPRPVLNKLGIKKLRMYFTGRNLFTITKYGGMDPELSSQRSIPLQKEYVLGLNFGL
ncbi:MAG: SusC/RagA family TonB-linked outer membrane protein [Bacteroidetes bacterium]|nr:MAG: SusC/RagA family TonB-linked outer membrane protein [Bacteroidota bacterium]